VYTVITKVKKYATQYMYYHLMIFVSEGIVAELIRNTPTLLYKQLQIKWVKLEETKQSE